MKKKICLAMSGLLAMGTVQAYGRDWTVRTEPHVYTAEAGTTHFLKDGEAQPLDAGEIKGKPAITGEGKAAVFALPLTEKYDEIENIGGGYFLAEKYQEKDVGLGQRISRGDNSYSLLDSAGKELLRFESGTIRSLESLGEGYFLVRNRDYKKEDMVIDKNGKTIFTTPYGMDPFSEGLAMVRTEDGVGYIDKSGKEVIPCQYRWGGYFRNGVTYVTEEDSQKTWLIDRTGKKLKLIATGKLVSYLNDSFRKDGRPKNGVLQKEEILEYGNTHNHVISLYDETGEISFEMYELKKGLSEGLSPWQDTETRKYGYVDENGVQVIAPAFDEAEPFKDGYAVVANEITKPDGEIDVEWGIIRHP